MEQDGSTHLPHRFKADDSHCRCKIDAANPFRSRYPEQLICVVFVNRRRQATRFAAEHQTVVLLEPSIQVAVRCKTGEKPHSTLAQSLEQILPMIGYFPLKMFPVVEPGAAECLFINPKSKRPNQPQLGRQGHARAAHRAGIRRDFGLIKHDVQSRFIIQGLANRSQLKTRLIQRQPLCRFLV